MDDSIVARIVQTKDSLDRQCQRRHIVLVKINIVRYVRVTVSVRIAFQRIVSIIGLFLLTTTRREHVETVNPKSRGLVHLADKYIQILDALQISQTIIAFLSKTLDRTSH